MTSGFDARPPILERVSTVLRGASSRLEGMSEPPPAPEAGACTASVAAALALLTDSMAGASESFDSVGGAVSEANMRYQADDADAGSVFGGVL